MELLQMSCEPLAMALPLLPAGSGHMGICGAAKPAALKANSLSRMDELQQHLARCDDASYLKAYVKVPVWDEFAVKSHSKRGGWGET
jgi:hypothetical protein